MSKDFLTLLFAALSVLFAVLAWHIAKITLTYMRGRDLELDDRNGWIEVHKAMVNLRVQREFIMLPAKMAALGIPSPTKSADGIKDYSLAAAQLRNQLERLNVDPLIVELKRFLDANNQTAEWQADTFPAKFDTFIRQVAVKSRPK